VKTGYWHTILTMATVEGEAELKAIPILGEGMNRQAWVVWLRDTYRKKASVRFCELVMSRDE
jgi:LysR family transcriptional regulator, cyn operon transcriptional activator